MRSQREDARRTDVAIVLTARVEPGRDFTRSWSRHWARAAFADISDVGIELRTDLDGVTMVIHRRGAGLTTLNVSISAAGDVGINA